MEIPHSFYICTADQSREMDTSTIDDFGIDGFTLMEIAGSSVAKYLLGELEPRSHGLYLCGKGNNAGDALVVARYLLQHGHKATLLFISGTDDLSSDTSHNLSLLEKINDNDPNSAGITILNRWDDFDMSSDFDFVVDGMLGTGLTSDLRGDYETAVEWSNSSGIAVYAIDIPTGLNADTGQIMGSAIEASKTFTFGALKQGFYLDEGYGLTGEVVYCDLPFPNYSKSCNTYLLDEAWIKEPAHTPARHKYEAGILYIVAGSEGLTGAALMAAQSAWAEGAGAVIVVCPRGILPVFENNLPQIIKKPVGDRDDYFFRTEHLESVLSHIYERSGNVLFGPGIGRDPSTLKFASGFFDAFTGDLLIDADALWCLAQRDQWTRPDDADWIITPHPGELAGLIKSELGNGIERLTHVRSLSSTKQITVVSKGLPVMVGTPAGKCYLTGYDTRIFARAGFGDVLAGKIGAYRAMGNSVVESVGMGLLNGYQKIKNIKKSKSGLPEPTDLI